MPSLRLLKTEEDFAAFRKSRGFASKTLKLRVHFRSNQNVPRFGFIVSKKTAAKAADRNLIKRRIKSLFLKRAGSLQPADFLIFPSSAVIKLKVQDLAEELDSLFTQAKVWK